MRQTELFHRLTYCVANRRGFTLMSTLVTMGLVSVLMAGTLSTLRIVHAGIADAGKSVELDRIADALSRTMRSPVALRITYQLSALGGQFRACLEESGRPDCRATFTTPLPLHNQLGAQVAGPVQRPPSPGRRYTFDGRPCDGISAQCPLIAHAFFVPVCPAAAAACDKAISFELSFTVGIDPQARGLFPALVPLRLRTGKVIVDTREVLSGEDYLIVRSRLQRQPLAPGDRGCGVVPPGSPVGTQFMHYQATSVCPIGWRVMGGGARCEEVPLRAGAPPDTPRGGSTLQSHPGRPPGPGTAGDWFVDCCVFHVPGWTEEAHPEGGYVVCSKA